MAGWFGHSLTLGLLISSGCTALNPDFNADSGDPTSAENPDGDELNPSDSTGGSDWEGSGVDGLPLECNPPGGARLRDRTCDGIDNDCDGLVDEDYVGLRCGVGQCRTESSRSQCIDGEEIACKPGQAKPEIPQDGIDQDCDGHDAANGSAIEGLVDDFEDDTIGPQWGVRCTDDCRVSESDGRLDFDMDGDQACRCEVESTELYSLQDSAVVLEISPITSFHEQLRFFMAVTTQTGSRIEFGFDGSDVFYVGMAQEGAKLLVDTSEYEPRPRYWRMSETQGELLFESSDDGWRWETEFRTSAPFSVGAVQFVIGTTVAGPMDTDIQIGVSTVNPAL